MKRFFEMDLTRRRLLRFFGVLGGGLVLGSGCERDESEDRARNGVVTQPGIDRRLQRAIREHFAYLSIDDPVIEAFARDLARHQGPWNPETSPRPYTRFLASTDFFQNAGNEARPLSYVAFYDPYVSSCYNPFERSS